MNRGRCTGDTAHADLFQTKNSAIPDAVLNCCDFFGIQERLGPFANDCHRREMNVIDPSRQRWSGAARHSHSRNSDSNIGLRYRKSEELSTSPQLITSAVQRLLSLMFLVISSLKLTDRETGDSKV
jgi:hypothetical protein